MLFRARIFIAALWLFLGSPLFSQTGNRLFDDIFPLLGTERKGEALSETGVIRSLTPGESLELLPSPASGIDLAGQIRAKGYPYLIESVALVPYGEKPLEVLDAYNALGKVRDLKGRLYRSHTRNAEIPLFEDAARMESDKRNNPLPDPAPSRAVPPQETVYLRLKDVNFGNTYYKADISPQGPGLLFRLTNYKTISYLVFPVMKEEKFTALLYLEPLAEGMLVYSVAGTEVSDFIARQIDIPSAISKRLAVFVDWIRDGLVE